MSARRAVGRAFAPPVRERRSTAADSRTRRRHGRRSRALEAGAERARQLVRAGRVAVRADRIDAHRDLRAVGGGDDAVVAMRTARATTVDGVVDDGAGRRPRRQRSVRLVGAIGEPFGGDREARRRPPRAPVPNRAARTGSAPDRTRAPPAQWRRQRPVADRHVVKRAVRLHVREPHAFARRRWPASAPIW